MGQTVDEEAITMGHESRTESRTESRGIGGSTPPPFQVLVLGDGDFSFSLALMGLLWGPPGRAMKRAARAARAPLGIPGEARAAYSCESLPNPALEYLGLPQDFDPSLVALVTTSFDTRAQLTKKYAEAATILDKMAAYEARGHPVSILHEINAWELDRHFPHHLQSLPTAAADASEHASCDAEPSDIRGFDVVIWNHPHLGLENLRLHRFLMSHFFQSAKLVLRSTPSHHAGLQATGFTPFVCVSLVEGQETRWSLLTSATTSGLQLLSGPEPVAESEPGFFKATKQPSLLGSGVEIGPELVETEKEPSLARPPTTTNSALPLLKANSQSLESRTGETVEDLTLAQLSLQSASAQHPLPDTLAAFPSSPSLNLRGGRPFLESDFPGYISKRNKTGESFKNGKTRKHVGHWMRSWSWRFVAAESPALFAEGIAALVTAAHAALVDAAAAPMVRTQTPARPADPRLTCPVCGRGFTSAFGRDKHHYHAHERQLYGADWVPDPPKVHICVACAKGFGHPDSLFQHRTNVHGHIEPGELDGALPAGELLPGARPEDRLEANGKGWKDEYVPCKVCGQAIQNRPWGMDLHLETLKPILGLELACPSRGCVKTFVDSRGLVQHYKFCRLNR